MINTQYGMKADDQYKSLNFLYLTNLYTYNKCSPIVLIPVSQFPNKTPIHVTSQYGTTINTMCAVTTFNMQYQIHCSILVCHKHSVHSSSQ